MDDLPPCLILEILSRLNDSTNLARCRLVSKTLNSLSREVRSISLLCTLSRYLKSRSPETRILITPFKIILYNLIVNSQNLESVSIGVEKSLSGISFDDIDDESDDLYLTDVGFVKQWLPRICRDLKYLLISDFWIQSCWRKSDVLALISSCCPCLLKLEMKNAWLSVDGLKQMPSLTNLTLEFIRLDDEDLNKVNDCFPHLQVLNLVGVGGLREPKIHLLHLKICQWTVSNAPVSLTISAPNLVKLSLKCIKPKSLILDTPLLSDFDLSLEKADEFKVKEFHNLKNFKLEYFSLYSLISLFPSGAKVKILTVDLVKSAASVERMRLGLEALFDVFPNVLSLMLGPGAWSEMESCFHRGGLEGRNGMKDLKEITAHLLVCDVDLTLSFMYSLLDKCTNLIDMALLFPREVDPSIGSKIISRCVNDHPRVRWKWGMWKEGTKDTWVSEGI